MKISGSIQTLRQGDGLLSLLQQLDTPNVVVRATIFIFQKHCKLNHQRQKSSIFTNLS